MDPKEQSSGGACSLSLHNVLRLIHSEDSLASEKMEVWISKEQSIRTLRMCLYAVNCMESKMRIRQVFRNVLRDAESVERRELIISMIDQLGVKGLKTATRPHRPTRDVEA